MASVLCGSFAIGQSPEKPKEETPKWDVNNPPGPRTTVPIDTRTGTWMNLDVSPEGDEIVFELLGDIYSMPIAGGEAKALTSGIAWDMQPRYSPDGKHIAFTSDRGGGDNIWIMNRDGSKAAQVSKEDFRLLNSPAWSPDGQFIAAHKHFSSTRSIGSGEVWLYHISGGAGVQMTKKPNDQKDVGRAGIFAGWKIRLLQPGHHARAILRVQQRSVCGHLHDPPPGSRDGRYRRRSSGARAARSGRLPRMTASDSRSCAASV